MSEIQFENNDVEGFEEMLILKACAMSFTDWSKSGTALSYSNSSYCCAVIASNAVTIST